MNPPVKEQARRWAIVAAVAVASAIGTFSLGAIADTPPKRGGTLEFAVLVEPGNCHANISFAFLHPIAPHYSTLLKFDAANYPQIVGDLAESWRVSPDRLTYTFTLRPNVLFHDGSKLTSADVKTSYERIAHPRRASSRHVRSITPRSAASTRRTPARWCSTCNGRKRRCWRISRHPGTASTAPQGSRRTRNFRRPRSSGRARLSLSSNIKGQYWRGARWEKYFQPGKPYLDGYRADFMTGPAVMNAYKSGKIPSARHQLPAIAPRLAKWRGGLYGVSYLPAASPKAPKAIRQAIRGWSLHTRSDKALHDLARMFNPYIRGWINYYSHFYKSALYPTLRRIDAFLLWWARRKFKRLRQRPKGARDWLARVIRSSPDLFAHWLLLYGQGRSTGAV
jgi:Bacterial extracellular solute-binding proteins, family 5 Middle/Group II intron, maturase-specific domain